MTEPITDQENREMPLPAGRRIKLLVTTLKNRLSDRVGSFFKQITELFSLNSRRWGLNTRFLLVTGMLLLAGTLFCGWFIFFTVQKNMQRSIYEQLTLLDYSIKDKLQGQGKMLSSLAAFIASSPEIMQSMEKQDRELLKNFVLPYMGRIRESSANSSIFLHFHLPPAISFLRTWDVNKWGDDLSKYRTLVVRSNRELASFTGFEVGQAGAELRSITPIFSNGKHLGSVEAGIDLTEVLQKVSLIQNYGIVVAIEQEEGSLFQMSPTETLTGHWRILKSYGDTDRSIAEGILEGKKAADRIGNIFYRRIPFQDFQGRAIGEFILTYSAGTQIQNSNIQITEFICFFLIGAIITWTVIYYNVRRVRVFLRKLEHIVIASQSNNFNEHFDSDHVHCLEVLKCSKKDCTVYQNPSLVCYLERGSRAISPRWRNTCVFTKVYNGCDLCPVYKMRHSDELTNMSNVMNTMMRSWSLFLTRVGALLSEVLRNQNQPWSLPSIDQVSDYLEQMARLTAFSHDLQGVYTYEEIYKQLSYVFEKHFLLEDYLLTEVSASDNRMTIAIHQGTLEKLFSQEVSLNSDLCRAKRVAEEICSYPNPVLCPYFNCDSEHIRCCLPMVMGGKVGAVFSFLVLKSEWESRRKQLVILRRYLDVTAPMLSSLRLLQKTHEQSLRDPLTHCYNRRFMDAYFDQYEPLAHRTGQAIGFLMADIDYFKEVNDKYGHQAGDSVLQQTVGMIINQIRSSDMLIRYGGEEFLIILPDVDPDALVSIAENIRVAVETCNFDLPDGSHLNKTISIGIAEYPRHGETVNKVIKFSDVALYAAKNQGRNRVVLFTPDMWTAEKY